MRALLVVNPKATATTRRTRDVLIRALASDLKVDVAETSRRGHAHDLAHQAVRDGLDLVIALGGDGTVNEVVNGLLSSGPEPSLPALAVVPAGSANVFARTLGLPPSPVEATGLILDALRTESRRSVGLGRADERWFTFCAGFGLDAEVVRVVERRRRAGRRATGALYVRSAVSHFFGAADRREPAITFESPDQPAQAGLYLGIVANTDPWTYLGNRPVRPTPEASFDSGLDLFAPRRLRTATALRLVAQMFNGRPPDSPRSLFYLHDVPRFTLRADRPLALQVDGDYLGERETVTFTAVPDALRVVV
ncbi:MAG: diacylglycerol kinase family lipid kinase [Actinomycetota bacterium]|nr:diacylglycerol kinase family lipid kinase [Actinomycetota bacterium]